MTRTSELQRSTLHILQTECRGPSNAMPMKNLYQRITGRVITPAKRIDATRTLRSIVSQLRDNSHPIADGEDGYFWATTPAELEPTIKKFHARALTAMRTEAALRHISLVQLMARKQTELELEPTTTEEIPA